MSWDRAALSSASVFLCVKYNSQNSSLREKYTILRNIYVLKCVSPLRTEMVTTKYHFQEPPWESGWFLMRRVAQRMSSENLLGPEYKHTLQRRLGCPGTSHGLRNWLGRLILSRWDSLSIRSSRNKWNISSALHSQVQCFLKEELHWLFPELRKLPCYFENWQVKESSIYWHLPDEFYLGETK